ncbi:MAG TPA: hypothetical protein VMR21_05590, partial [Vicinamibacteria bacterium]|nr:hypothetical protein [Vicinamibacteria bacterium]
MLARIRQALAARRTAATSSGSGPVAAAGPEGAATVDLAGTFRREAERVGASVHGPLSPAAAREKALGLLGPVP